MTTQSVNPRSGEPFGPVFADSTDAEVAAAVDRAVSAASAWARFDAAARANALNAIADGIDAQSEALASLADAETGLGMPRLVGEVARTSFQLRMFADAVRSGMSLEVMIDPAVAGNPPAGHPELRRMLMPLGPVAVFGASNFPFAFSVLGGDTASALAAGCTVVAKAHPSHPQTCEAVAAIACEALAHAAAPDGTFALVRGVQAGVALIEHPGITAGAFTGSTAGGRALFDLAAARPIPIPFYGELGSVNPVIVSPQAASRSELAAEYVASLCLGTGQFCTNPGVILVPRASGLAEGIASTILDQPAGVLLNANVQQALGANASGLAAIAGVRAVASNSPAADEGPFVASPMVLITDVPTALGERRLLTTECFGPVGVVVEFEDLDEVLMLVNVLQGCLVSTMHADADEEFAAAVMPALVQRSGRIVWNGWPTGVAVTAAQHHGGPYPASTNALHTSVGTTAMRRFQRPVAFQSVPEHLLPSALR